MRSVDLRALPPRLRPLYQRCAAAVRRDFSALTDGLYPEDGDPARLLAGALSRSPSVGTLFESCLALRFIEELLACEGCDEVVTDLPALARVLEAGLYGTGTRVRLESSLAARLTRLLRPLVRAAKAAVRAARSLDLGRRLPPGLPPLTLLDTFLLPASFRDGRFHDRYYPGLLEALTPAERASVLFLPEVPADQDAPAMMRAAEASGAPFLFKTAYLTAGDHLAALLSPLKTLRAPRGPVRFGRFDAAPLVRAEAWETAWNDQSLAAVLNVRFAARLRESGVAVRLVVDWSENQLLDRGLCLGFRRAYPGVPVVGHQGYIISPDRHPYVRPTPRERAAGLVPDRLFVTGPALVAGARELDPGLDVAAGPAFRFSGVHAPRRARPDPAAVAVLLALPISRDGARDILTLAADADLPGVRFAVKAHPAVPEALLRADLEAAGRRSPASFALVGGDFGEAVEKADVMAGSISSTCVEALAKGVPVVIVGNPRGITEDPIPPGLAPEMRRLAFTPAEFAAAVMELASKEPGRRARAEETGRAVAAACFAPADEAGARRLLQLERTKT